MSDYEKIKKEQEEKEKERLNRLNVQIKKGCNRCSQWDDYYGCDKCEQLS